MTGKSTLHCQNNYYDISYRISDATVTSLPTDSNDGLVMSIQNSTHGIITVSFPREYMDQISGNIEQKFVVMANGQEIWTHDIIDQSNSTHRILTINLPNGNFDLEIPYSNTPEGFSQHHKSCVVVPEFGSLEGMIIVTSIIGVIVLSRKFSMK